MLVIVSLIFLVISFTIFNDLTRKRYVQSRLMKAPWSRLLWWVVRKAKRPIFIVMGCIVLSGSLHAQKFFGTMEESGGVIFSIDTNDNFSVLRRFYQSEAQTYGERPYSTLLWSDNKLWGTTYRGGNNDNGVLFSINPDGSNYLVHHRFSLDGSDGANSQSALTVDSNGLLWGMTENGGKGNNGVIFTYNRSNNTYIVRHRFTDVDDDGIHPRGALTLANGKLWGVTFEGGNGEGVIFSIEEDGQNYTIEYEWKTTGANDGGNPSCDLFVDGDRLLGTATRGGGNSGENGVLFQLDLNNSDFEIIHNFTDASNPQGRLIKVGDDWWGVASEGGEGHGAVYRLNDKDEVSIQYQFDDDNNEDGSFPVGGLAEKGNFLYGMTRIGGDDEEGVAFRVELDGDYDVDGFEVLRDFGIGDYPGNPQNSALIWVADIVAPNLTTVSIASNNNDNMLAKPGDVVTLSFTPDEDLQNVLVTIAGESVTATYSNLTSTWTASYTLTNSDADGILAFTIDAQDSYGNPLLQPVTATSDGSSVTYDKTAPTLSFSTPVSVEENTTSVQSITANETISSWSVGGTDAGRFSISGDGTSTGNLVFSVSPDFESPSSANAENNYIVTVTARDEAGNSFTTNHITITVTDAIEPASFSIDNIPNANVSENTGYTGPTPSITGTPIGSLTWSLGGADQVEFNINSGTGVVTLVAQDYESPSDANVDNVYEVRITATDEDGNSATEDWIVTITDDNTEPADFIIDAILDVSVAENASYTSPEPNIIGTPIGMVTWSLGGADQGLFSIDSITGVVTLVAQDYEFPSDANEDNTYEVSITATDADGNSATEFGLITVDDAVEITMFSIDTIANVSVSEHQGYTGPAPNITGSPIGTVTWSLGGADQGLFSIDSLTGVVTLVAQDYESPSDADEDNVYEVSITATDADGNSATASWLISIDDVVEVVVFRIDTIVNVVIAENVGYVSVIPRLLGDDPIGQVTWSLGGADRELFRINRNTGEVSLGAQDYESRSDTDSGNTYEVRITATDEDGNSDDESWTVIVTDIVESTIFYPNPASTVLNIMNASSYIKISILDLKGREIEYNQLSTDKFDVSSISAGMYILEIQTRYGFNRRFKLRIQR